MVKFSLTEITLSLELSQIQAKRLKSNNETTGESR